MARPRTRPVRNVDLARLIAETGRTYQSIAATINRVSSENGAPAQYSAASLARWLNGSVPLPESVPAVVEAFTRLLDRAPLTPTDLGWSSDPLLSDAEPHDPWRGDPVAWVARLGRSDMLDRRTTIAAGLYSLAAAVVSLAPPAEQAARTSLPARVGASDVARVREMARLFGHMDDLYGGGHARTAVAAYLVNDVVPLLHAATGSTRPDLFAAAAEVAYLAGWMAADDLRPGLAQRYYIQSVRLASESGAPLMRATALRSLASQAVELGHASQGIELANAAADAVREHAPIRTRAWVTGMQAEALAASGRDSRRAIRLLGATEVDLERADSPPASQWTGNYQREGFEHQVGLTLLSLGDLPGAEEHLAASVAARKPTERRTRALVGTRLATVQIRLRRPEAAAATLLGLADDFAVVKSARLLRSLGQIRDAWRPARGDTTVETADQLLRSVQVRVVGAQI